MDDCLNVLSAHYCTVHHVYSSLKGFSSFAVALSRFYCISGGTLDPKQHAALQQEHQCALPLL